MRTNNHHEGQCIHCPGHNCSNGEQLMNERTANIGSRPEREQESQREWEEQKVDKAENGSEIHSNISKSIERNQLNTLTNAM